VIDLLVTLLVFVFVAAIVLWLVGLILDRLPIGTAARNITLAIVAALLLLVLLRQLGWA
jgi:hypothetical protein